MHVPGPSVMRGLPLLRHTPRTGVLSPTPRMQLCAAGRNIFADPLSCVFDLPISNPHFSVMGAMELSAAQMPTQRDNLLQMLPAEAVTLILEGLGFRDLMALRVSCRALREWLPHATR